MLTAQYMTIFKNFMENTFYAKNMHRFQNELLILFFIKFMKYCYYVICYYL